MSMSTSGDTGMLPEAVRNGRGIGASTGLARTVRMIGSGGKSLLPGWLPHLAMPERATGNTWVEDAGPPSSHPWQCAPPSVYTCSGLVGPQLYLERHRAE